MATSLILSRQTHNLRTCFDAIHTTMEVQLERPCMHKIPSYTFEVFIICDEQQWNRSTALRAKCHRWVNLSVSLLNHTCIVGHGKVDMLHGRYLTVSKVCFIKGIAVFQVISYSCICSQLFFGEYKFAAAGASGSRGGEGMKSIGHLLATGAVLVALIIVSSDGVCIHFKGSSWNKVYTTLFTGQACSN